MSSSTLHATDAIVREAVEAELAWSPQVHDAAKIGVAVDDGIVTLTGTVSAYSQKIAAGKAALETRGVVAVANNIDVIFGARHDDTDLAERARDALRLNAQVPLNRLHLQVSNGFVTLTGTVDWEFQRAAAHRTIASLDGVRSIIDNIELPPRPTSDRAKSEIHAAFSRLADVDAEHIGVEVIGTTVRLTGQVSSYAEKQAAARAVWGSPHVTHVTNDLRVVAG